jgi:hypothetical protein
MAIQPRPKAETSGPLGPNLRFFISDSLIRWLSIFIGFHDSEDKALQFVLHPNKGHFIIIYGQINSIYLRASAKNKPRPRVYTRGYNRWPFQGRFGAMIRWMPPVEIGEPKTD